MLDSAPSHWLVEALAPLDGALGGGLRFSREGSSARWSHGDHTAIVELSGLDRIAARFVAPPSIDAVSGEPATPEYLRDERGYPLTAAGCERLVTDMLAFFSGTREPVFTFIATR